MLYSAQYDAPVGRLTLAANGEALTGLWLDGQKYFGAGLAAEARQAPDLPVFAAAADWLDQYFANRRPQIADLPLAPAGSEFRRAVWQVLCEIPYGQVATYGQVAVRTAEKLGRSVSPRAVGGAVGHNPISIIIPCHRVVGRGGSLTGYAGGLERKRWLLEREGALTPLGTAVPCDRWCTLPTG